MIESSGRSSGPSSGHPRSASPRWQAQLTSVIDWLRRADFVAQKLPYVAVLVAVGANLLSTVTDVFERVPIVGGALSSIGAGAIVLAIGLALRGERKAEGPRSAQALPKAEISVPPLFPERVQQAERLLSLADTQRRNWSEYFRASVRAVDFDWIGQNEPHVVLSVVLANRSVFDVTVVEFGISNAGFWQTPESAGARPHVHGTLRRLPSSSVEQVIEAGREWVYRHEWYLSPETTTMLRDLDARHAEVHFDMTLNWRLRFADREERWGTRALFVECPKRSHERQF